jgi:subtilisin family serine protease
MVSGIKFGDFVPSQIVIFANTPAAKNDIIRLAKDMRASVRHENKHFDVFLFSFLSDTDAAAALKKVNKKYAGLFSASRNWKLGIPPTPAPPPKVQGGQAQPQHVTNDPGARASWWLEKIKEPYSGNPLAEDKNIAVIDTGVDYTHSELLNKAFSVFDYVNWDADAMDDHGHGTHVAGIAAAKAGNGTGIHGVSPNSKIYAYKVLDNTGSGGWYQIMTAITDAADNPNVSILNLSLGGDMVAGTAEYNTFQAAVNYARWTKGKIVCVAAGNEANVPHYDDNYDGTVLRPVPAYFPACFTVGATTHHDSRSWFTNYDVNTPSGDGTVTYNFSFVDIVAPGVGILSTIPGERYDSWDGTSMATPMVAGACARVWGKNPGFTPAQVQTKLVTTGKWVAQAQGFPLAERRVDLMKALDAAATGLQGFVYHAESIYPVYNVKVEAHEGSAGGPLAATAYSDKAGVFTLTGLTAGTTYFYVMSKAGYLGLSVWGGTPTAGTIKDGVAPHFLVPGRASTASDDNWRIIASWRDEDPGYYDMYLGYLWGYSTTWYPFEYFRAAGFEANCYLKDPAGIVYGWDNPGALGEAPYVKYMYDSFDGVPLECFVIQRDGPGIYSYVLSADPDDFCWGAIKYGLGGTIYPSLPLVKIYKGNTFKGAISSSTATQDGTGTKYWHVFDLDAATGVVTVVNMITDTWPL